MTGRFRTDRQPVADQAAAEGTPSRQTENGLLEDDVRSQINLSTDWP